MIGRMTTRIVFDKLKKLRTLKIRWQSSWMIARTIGKLHLCPRQRNPSREIKNSGPLFVKNLSRFWDDNNPL